MFKRPKDFGQLSARCQRSAGGAAWAVGRVCNEQHEFDGGEEQLFEIGSITKGITGVLLALLVVRGDTQLEEPVRTWMPDAGGAADATLRQLATHTSGLPRLAPNAFLDPEFDSQDPYRHFDIAELIGGLRQIPPVSATATPEYSNLGFQLLGVVLERITSTPYPTLLQSEVFAPLGMSDSRVTGAGAVAPVELAQGHARRRATPTWTQPLPAAGGVLSTVRDLAVLAGAVMASSEDALGRAFRLATTPQLTGQGLGWALTRTGIVWHNGATGGFRSMMAANPTHHRAAATLIANSIGPSIDEHVIAYASHQSDE